MSWFLFLALFCAVGSRYPTDRPRHYHRTQIPFGNDNKKGRGRNVVLTKRIIACLDVRDGRVVKGIQFLDIVDAGDPAELAHRHARGGADEIVLLDITATHEGRGTLLDTVRRTAAQLFVPFTVGGGIRSAEDAAAVFTAGADKVSINSSAIARPELIGEIGASFGAQAVIVAIDARRGSGPPRPGYDPVGDAEVYVSGGRKPTGLRVIDWAREAEQRGAGEILLTSMDTDGMRNGFDCELTRRVSEAVQIPVIASGGAGSAAHFAEVFLTGKADAALAASIFHFGITDSRALKAEVAAAGVPMRLPC
jgi:cyclase